MFLIIMSACFDDDGTATTRSLVSDQQIVRTAASIRTETGECDHIGYGHINIGTEPIILTVEACDEDWSQCVVTLGANGAVHDLETGDLAFSCAGLPSWRAAWLVTD